MRRLLVSPIVTGHGEFHCVRILLERIWYEELRVPEGHIEVLRPLRHPQSTLETKDGLQKAVRQAHMDLSGELRRRRSNPWS
jgi:hypothetical protein